MTILSSFFLLIFNAVAGWVKNWLLKVALQNIHDDNRKPEWWQVTAPQTKRSVVSRWWLIVNSNKAFLRGTTLTLWRLIPCCHLTEMAKKETTKCSTFPLILITRSSSLHFSLLCNYFAFVFVVKKCWRIGRLWRLVPEWTAMNKSASTSVSTIIVIPPAVPALTNEFS